MDELKWNWAYLPYLDPPENQKESALKAGYIKVVNKNDADKVIAGKDKEIRRLRKALYKACANWAHHRVFVRYKTNEKAWENVERKCRAKAEEYK